MTVPGSIGIPPPPPLDSSRSSDRPATSTNTLALLLPHLALFSPPVLALLKGYYEQYGQIRVWAPVKGFGRVIVVYATEGEAAKAKQEGDWLELDLDAGKEETSDDATPQEQNEGDVPYFNAKKRKYKPNRYGFVAYR
jgi:hypothetical protein